MKTGGTVRIREDIWDTLTRLSVKATIHLARPVNQSKVLHFILDTYIDEVAIKELVKLLNDAQKNL